MVSLEMFSDRLKIMSIVLSLLECSIVMIRSCWLVSWLVSSLIFLLIYLVVSIIEKGELNSPVIVGFIFFYFSSTVFASYIFAARLVGTSTFRIGNVLVA